MQKQTEIGKTVLNGPIGGLVANITENWLLTVEKANPAILEMFKDAGKEPLRVLAAWSGEFAGKYLTGACEVYSLTRDEKLGECINSFANRLCDLQKEDGYIGTWGKDFRFKSESPVMHYVLEDPSDKRDANWDLWNHYHIILGLLNAFRTVGNTKALECAKKAADLICSLFYTEDGGKISDIASPETNFAIIHAMALVGEVTGRTEYTDFAVKGITDLNNVGNIFEAGLCGKDFYRLKNPRWEWLHTVEAFVALYRVTGDRKYLKSSENLWYSMTKSDLHNTYGFSTSESAQGTPFLKGAVETCCSVAYTSLTANLLFETGNPLCADILEKCLYNTGMATFSPSGRWSVYSTPTEGYKRANYHENSWQSRPGSPDLNCCSANAPRLVGILSKWAFCEDEDALVINFYGDLKTDITLSDGRKITVTETTSYPADGKIGITLSGDTDGLSVKVRIPSWTKKAQITEGGTTHSVSAGYVTTGCLDFTLDFDMTLRFTVGEDDFTDRISVSRGPLVLCCDAAFSESFFPIPEIAPDTFEVKRVLRNNSAGFVFECETQKKPLALCDLYTAGFKGTVYTTWFLNGNAEVVPFSDNTLDRSFLCP